MAINGSYLQYGGDLMLFALPTTSGATLQALAFSTSAKLSISMATREISSKDSGDFIEKMPAKFSWNISTDALMNYVSTGTTQSTDEFTGYMLSKKLLNVAFASKTGTSPSWTVDASKKKFTGTAWITSIDLNAGDGATATYSIQLEGTGPLVLA